MNLRSIKLGFTAPAALARLLAATGSVFSQRGPIKIGLLVPLTGPLSANGKEMANGITLYLEEQNHQLAGREAQLIVEDTEVKPPIALNKARALAESHGVHVLVGPLATAEAYALVSYLERQKIPTLPRPSPERTSRSAAAAPTSSAPDGRPASRGTPSASTPTRR